LALVAPDQADQGTRRPYRSPVRQQRAMDTRQRITAAAGELFAEHGFAGTTVTDIAARAGVAAPTVYATFGSKGAIVRALLAQLEQDADSGGWVRCIAEETDPHAKLAAFAQWTTALLSSSKSTIAAARGASAEPAIIELRDEGDRRRREGLRALIAALAHINALLPDLSQEHAVDRAWMLTGLDLYLSATQGCRWTDAEYENWLTALLQQQLLIK